MNRVGKAGMALAAGLLFAAAARAEVRPAELPPAGYKGLQYVDSQGCAFLRAGTAAKPVWVPRVSAGGAPMCDNPPSGNRVPVAGEAGADTTVFEPDAAASEGKAKRAESTVPVATGEYIIAVGSFGVSQNADRAVARLNELGYPASRGRMRGGSPDLITVFAGPYASAEEAKAALTTLRGEGFPDAVVLSP